MTFIVILIALLIERFFDWSHLRRWQFYLTAQEAVLKRLPGKSPYLILALTLIPLLVLVWLIGFILDDWLYGLLTLLFELFVLLYCLGPQNLWADTFACINVLTQGDTLLAAEKLKTSFGITNGKGLQGLRKKFLNHIFIEANRRVFAVIFWYAILGPIGAVLYRALTVSSDSKQQELSPELSQSARTLEEALDWIPIRLLTFVFALGGHFVQVVSCWHKKLTLGLAGNDALLIDCGTAAISGDDQDKIDDNGASEKNAVSLLDRVFIIVLVVIAIAVLLL